MDKITAGIRLYHFRIRRKNMNRKMIASIAMALGVLSFGAVAASAADSCCSGGKCSDSQTVRQFKQATSGLSTELQAKERELRNEYLGDTVDTHRIQALEAERNEIKSQLQAIGTKDGIPACCIS